MPAKVMAKKAKSVAKNGAPLVFPAIFENGVLKPLTKVRLPRRKKLIVSVLPEEDSIAAKIHGLFKMDDPKDLDAIIESEDWL